MAKGYLFLYNIASCAGWAYVFYQLVQCFLAGMATDQMWAVVGPVLQVVQSMAALEVLHSLFGLVRSPIVSTLMQVASRLVLLWCYSSVSQPAQAHWSLWLMIGSWALVEVPRYLFYALNLFTSKVPFPLFWLRYSLFMVLYPSGITGEVLQIISSLELFKTTAPNWYLFSLALLAIYVPGSPYMFLHMMKQRKRASQARANAGKPPAPEKGLLFPKGKRNDRSTTEAGKNAFAAAMEVVDPEAAAKVRKERDWRFGYNRHVVSSVKLAATSPENCLKMAHAGLKWLHSNFEFVHNGKTMTLEEAMNTVEGSFETGVIRGTKPKPASFTYKVPYKGRDLTGDELLAQLQKWATYGTIEPEAEAAIAACVHHPEWLDLSDRYFVLLGAGSAMGPLLVLLSLGANVIAVDINFPRVWERLIRLARDSCGQLIFPLKKPQNEIRDDQELYSQAGCDLFVDTPMIRNWLLTVEPEKPLTIGGYAYLDGARHVQVALAMDAIMEGVYKKRKNVALAFLCSPTDCFVRLDAAREGAKRNLRNAPLWQKFISAISFGRFLVDNTNISAETSTGENLSIVDGLVVAQGPNYALAKRLQHWRAMVARDAGCVVSSNIAPSTSTASVVHNKQFAAAYGGMHHFKPMEIMGQETSNAVMAALLIHDIRNEEGAAFPKFQLRNPLELFAYGAFHGGIWRCGYKINSMGEIAALIYYTKVYGLLVSCVGVALSAAGYYLVSNALN